MSNAKIASLLNKKKDDRVDKDHYDIHTEIEYFLSIFRSGTPGQVLTKTGPKPYDLKWV